MPSPSAPAILPLCVGLALGATATWTARHFLTDRAAPGVADATSASIAPAGVADAASVSARPATDATTPPLVVPPRLDAAEADAALAAYLALPALDRGAPEADVAERATRLRALLTVLPTARFEPFLTALAARTGGAEARLRRIAFAAWLELDAPAAARWMIALQPGPGLDAKTRQGLATDAALAWADAAFDDAYAWAGALPDTALGDTLARALLGRLADTDPRRALALAEARGGEFLTAARTDLLRVWAKHDPASAVRTLGAAVFKPGINSNNWELTNALAAWNATDPRAAFDWIFALPADEPRTIRELVRRSADLAIAKGDPRPIADLLLGHPDIPERTRVVGSFLQDWAASSPEAALAWLDSVPDGSRRADLLAAALGTWNRENPEKNLPLALHLPPGAARDHELREILERWQSANAEAAAAWVERMRPDPSFAAVVADYDTITLGTLAAIDPAAALGRWQALPDGPAKTAASAKLAQSWSATDPAAAVRWFLENTPLPSSQTLANSFNQPEPYRSLFANWGHRDPAGFVRWAGTEAPPELRSGALLALLAKPLHEDTEHLDPALGAELVAALPDRQLANSTLFIHLQRWLRDDPELARAWLDSHDVLSPEQAARLLSLAGLAQP